MNIYIIEITRENAMQRMADAISAQLNEFGMGIVIRELIESLQFRRTQFSYLNFIAIQLEHSMYFEHGTNHFPIGRFEQLAKNSAKHCVFCMHQLCTAELESIRNSTKQFSVAAFINYSAEKSCQL